MQQMIDEINHNFLSIFFEGGKANTNNYVNVGGWNLSFDHLKQIAETISESLMEANLPKASVVAIDSSFSIDLFLGILAAWRLQLQIIVLQNRMSDKEKTLLLQESGAQFLLIGKNALKTNDFPGAALNFSIERKGTLPPLVPENPNDTAVIVPSSGSTAEPKLVRLTFQNLRSNAENWNSFLKFETADNYMLAIPGDHIGGLSIFFRALLYDFSVYILEANRPQQLLETIENGHISIVSMVSYQLKKLIEYRPPSQWRHVLRAIILGGGPIPPAFWQEIVQCELPVIVSYGMTETASGIAAAFVKDSPSQLPVAGRPFSDVKLHIENGEILLDGPMVFPGYFGEADRVGAFRTDDLGRLDEMGFLMIQNRKGVVLSGGVNIPTSTIQAELELFDEVDEAIVFGIPDEEWGEMLCAGVKLSEGATEPNWKSRLQHLHNWHIPKDIRVLEEFPRNAMGKVNYRELKNIFSTSGTGKSRDEK